MPCKIVKDKSGKVTAIFCGRSSLRKCFYCGGPGYLLCDWRIVDIYGDFKKTCDRPICAKHSTHVGQNRDYCQEHSDPFLEDPTTGKEREARVKDKPGK